MAIKAYYIFYKAFIFSLFNAKKERALIIDLFTKFSYRYDTKLARTYKAPLIYFKKSAELIFKQRTYEPDDWRWKTIVFESQTPFKAGDKDYLRYNGVEGINFIFRDQLPNELGIISRISLLFFLCTVFMGVLPFSVFSKDKAKPSLILLELTENALLYSSLKKMGIKKMYFLSPYEKDAYLTSYLVQSGGIFLSIIPSSNPISFFYKRVLCNQFIFTAPFQQIEYSKLNSNWDIENTVLWKPFESQSVKLNMGGVSYTNEIGFVSSGMYLRKEKSHINALGMNDYKAEMALILAIKKFIRLQSKSLIVYLHPFEKSSKENLNSAIAYYKGEFGDDVVFAPFDEPSKRNFHLAEVAVSGFSSAQIERLYGGYKTLFAPMGYLSNYFNDSRLDVISVNNEEELAEVVTNLLATSEEEYFRSNNLQDYHWKAFEVKIT